MYRLRRSLYGFKQAPQASYTRIETYLSGLGFTKSEAEANLDHILVDEKLFILDLYIDDLILTRDEELVLFAKRIMQEN